MSPRRYWMVLTALAILFLTVTPAYAAPSLSLGKQATYKLSGQFQMNQSCTGSPIQYATEACNPSIIQYQSYSVSIIDNGLCPSPNNGTCFFSPSYLTISADSTVHWYNSGSMAHTVTSNNTLNIGLPSFDSGVLSSGQSYAYTFTVPGTYAYYDAAHQWVKGTIQITPAASSVVQTPSPINIGFDGTLSWTVIGLGNDTANLKVSHSIGVSISPMPGLTITPVTETGSFEQSITLSTRTESPGTATSILKNLLTTVLDTSYPSYTSSATVFPTVIGRATSMLSATSPEYTTWWVNGPLTLGSPVRIMTGTSSVTGDENLNLGSDLGTRSGWVVTSDLSQSVNVITSLTTPASTVNFNLNLLWSYDKQSDILLRSNMNATVVTVSSSQQQVITSNPCLPNGWCPTYTTVTAIRTMRMTVGLTTTLDSTNLPLSTRTLPDPASPSSPGLLSGLVDPFWPAAVATVAIILAGTVGMGVWYVRKSRNRPMTTPDGPLPQG